MGGSSSMVSDVGFLMNLSFPADARLVSAFRDMVAQAVRQAGGDDAHARRCGEQAAAFVSSSAEAGSDANILAVLVQLGPPIQVIVSGRTLTLEAS